jgi:hypothetical protein
MSCLFNLPFRAQLVGSTSSGKTYFVVQLLKYSDKIFSEKLASVKVFYVADQHHYGEMSRYTTNIEFYKNIPTNLDNIIDTLDNKKHHLFIFDDLMASLFYNKTLLRLFISASHHQNISVILLLQSLHLKTQLSRTIGLQSDIFVFFNNWRDKQDIRLFSRQVDPDHPRFILDSYIKALSLREYGYLIVNLQHKLVDQRFRIITGIFPGESFRVFLHNTNSDYISNASEKKFNKKKKTNIEC